MKIKIMLMSCLFCMFVLQLNGQDMNEMWGTSQGNRDTDTQRGKLFRDGNYAMFIHWGLYSQLANQWKGKTYYGIGEWMMNKNMGNIPADEYVTIAKDFNPVKFNAREIVQLARDAGMKYIIITSKHHDGFAMYHSKASTFNITDATPFGRDPMKELSQACKEAGIGFGFYYSHNQDWTTPFGTVFPAGATGDPKTFDSYFKYKCLPQVEEITTGYGPIELVWFDTPGNMPKDYIQQLVDVVRRNQPDALVSGRAGHGLGDYSTLGDMEVPVENVDGLWESVDVTNDSWGYAWYDQNWKSPSEILMRLISTVARGGTYMLNVGPKGDGTIPGQAAMSLRAAGKWIGKYPEVIYSAGPSPWKHALPWGDVTVNGKEMFLCVYHWPASGKLYLPGLQSGIVTAKLLGGRKQQSLSFRQDNGWTVLDIPGAAPDRLVSVIKVVSKEEPRADHTLGIDPVVPTRLSVNFAEAIHCRKNKREWMEKFGEWKQMIQVDQWSKQSKVTWTIDILTPGNYLVELFYAGNGRLVWAVENSEGTKIQNQQNSSHIYSSHPIGWMSFDKPGRHTITVTLPEGDPENVSLAAVRFEPVVFN